MSFIVLLDLRYFHVYHASMTMRVSVLRGQNFLRHSAIAERIVQVANPISSHICVDIGAGTGIITRACLAADYQVMVIEIDDRLFARLQKEFSDNPRVKLFHESLTTVSLPQQPFSITSNPPFNQSTEIFRRWVLNKYFQSAAIVTQHQFARKMAGDFGATKISTALSPFRKITVSEILPKSIFHPRPNVPVSMTHVECIGNPIIPWSERKKYWLLVNYLFECGPTTVRKILTLLNISNIPKHIAEYRLRDLRPQQVVDLYRIVDTPAAWKRIRSFDRQLPENRRLRFGVD